MSVIKPWCACAAKLAVLSVSVCLSVCLSVSAVQLSCDFKQAFRQQVNHVFLLSDSWICKLTLHSGVMAHLEDSESCDHSRNSFKRYLRMVRNNVAYKSISASWFCLGVQARCHPETPRCACAARVAVVCVCVCVISHTTSHTICFRSQSN